MATKYMKLGYTDRVIDEKSFAPIVSSAGHSSGFKFDVKINYYRGMPLSCVETFDLYVDGEKIPENLFLFWLNGKPIQYHQMKDMYMEFWGLHTRLSVWIYAKRLEPGEHDIRLDLIFRNPYMQYAPGVYGKFDSSCEKRVTIS